MDYQTIEYSVDNQVGTICLNRPESLNSFNADMHADLRAVFKIIKADRSLRCLVITGNGKAFSSGQDLSDRYKLVNSDAIPNLGESLEKNYNPLIKRIAELTIPVVCAVNGLAAGAGVSIALACDIVIAAKSAKFVFAFSKVGLIPDSGGTWALVNALGLPRAKALTLLGETISASEAVAMGMIWRCVDDEKLSDELETTTQKILANPPLGLSLTKRALMAAVNNEMQIQLAQESQYQTVAGRDDNYAEAVRAFVEKRPAEFKSS